MSMQGPGPGAAFRHLRSDRSVVNNRLDRGTVRRVVGFARPHRGLISVFLGLTVVDAAMVVVIPLLVQRIVDDGILAGDNGLVAAPGAGDGGRRPVQRRAVRPQRLAVLAGSARG